MTGTSAYHHRAWPAVAAIALVAVSSCTGHDRQASPVASSSSAVVRSPASPSPAPWVRWRNLRESLAHPAEWTESSDPDASVDTMAYFDVILTNAVVADPCASTPASDQCETVPGPLPANAVWVRWFDWQGNLGPGKESHLTRIDGLSARIIEGPKAHLNCLAQPGVRLGELWAAIYPTGPEGVTVEAQACYTGPDLAQERAALVRMVRSYRYSG